MRIAVIATTRNPLTQPFAGGQEAQTAAVLRGMRRAGHTIRLYARDGTDLDLCDELAAYPVPPVLSRISELDLHLPEPDFLRDETAMAWAMSDLARRPVDVVHNQSLHHLPLAMSAALPSPMVTTLHCPPFPWMEVGVALAGPAVRYVAVSMSSAAQWSMLPTRPRVVLNGIDPSAFPFGAGGEGLVWVGRITPEKGTDLAIRAAREAGLPLRVVGPVSDRRYFEHHVQPLLGGDIEHLGHLTNQETAEVVGSSAVSLVTPRWEEPFGLVAAEAMMCGTPVVALRRGGLPEVVSRRSGVLVPDLGRAEAALADDLAAAVPRAAALDRRAVRAHAEEQLGHDRMVREYLEVFAELLDGLASVSTIRVG